MSEIKDMQFEYIEKLKREIALMDDALMQIAALPTIGGGIARDLIEEIRQKLSKEDTE